VFVVGEAVRVAPLPADVNVQEGEPVAEAYQEIVYGGVPPPGCEVSATERPESRVTVDGVTAPATRAEPILTRAAFVGVACADGTALSLTV
jgi:hypothetical protein